MHPIQHAKSRADRPAIIMAGSGETVTYAQLDEAANRVAHLLRSLGLKPGDAFAVLMENNARYFEIVWGSQRAGTMLVPISTRLTPPEIAYILRDSEARLLLSSQHFADTVARLRAEMPDLPVLMLGSGGADDLATALATQPDTCLLYTSPSPRD